MKKSSILLVFISFTFLWSCGGEEPQRRIKRDVKKTPKTETKQDNAADVKSAESTVPPEQLAKAKEIIASVSDDDIAKINAKATFKKLCSICHGMNGALGVNGAKDLTQSTISLEESVAQVYHGKGLMTPFKGLMKDAEIVAVAKYIEDEMAK